jgi:hypothetical protein
VRLPETTNQRHFVTIYPMLEPIGFDTTSCISNLSKQALTGTFNLPIHISMFGLTSQIELSHVTGKRSTMRLPNRIPRDFPTHPINLATRNSSKNHSDVAEERSR